MCFFAGRPERQKPKQEAINDQVETLLPENTVCFTKRMNFLHKMSKIKETKRKMRQNIGRMDFECVQLVYVSAPEKRRRSFHLLNIRFSIFFF